MAKEKKASSASTVSLTFGIVFFLLSGVLFVTDKAIAEQSIVGREGTDKLAFDIGLEMAGLDLDCSDGKCEYHYGYYRVFDKSGTVLASGGPVALDGKDYKTTASFEMISEKAVVLGLISKITLSFEEGKWKVEKEETGVYDAVVVLEEPAADESPEAEEEQESARTIMEVSGTDIVSPSLSGQQQAEEGITPEEDGNGALFYGSIGSLLASLASFAFFGVSKFV